MFTTDTDYAPSRSLTRGSALRLQASDSGETVAVLLRQIESSPRPPVY